MPRAIKEMKVLNIAQPNAHKVIFKGKNVENRSKSSNLRGTIAIYASKTMKKHFFEEQGIDSVEEKECSFGCIIGFVDMVDCITEEEVSKETKKWFVGDYGYVLQNVRILKKPIAVSPPNGAIIWWNLSGSDLNKCLDQVDTSDFIPIISLDLNTKVIANDHLAEIVGDKTMKIKEICDLVITYADEKGLISTLENGDCVMNADGKLKRAFGRESILPNELTRIVVQNSKVA